MKKIIYTRKAENYKDHKPNDYIIPLQSCWFNSGGMGNLSKLKPQNYPKTKNTFVHVFWSKPAQDKFSWWADFGQYEITLALSALSLACLKEFGQKVVLITDTPGKELLEDLPYDEIYTILDDYNIPKKFWAAGKIAALKYLSDDATLIDNDLFIYDGTLIDKIAENDIVCCITEKGTMNSKNLLKGLKKIPWLKKANTLTTSQTSILKVNNNFLKQLFIDTYNEIVGLFTDNEGNLIEDLKDECTPDLVAEQFNFHCLCDPVPTVENTYFWTDIKGLCHLMAQSKYLKLPVVLEKLQKLFPDYYKIVMNKWKELKFKIIFD